jgi:hypothetical protein
MKQVLFVLMAALILIGCGAGHANLTSITVSPQSATTTSSPQGQVGYTAMGNFQNGKSRELSQVDGLSWKTSPTSTGTVAATIGSTGEVICSAPGTVNITASPPQNLQFTLNNGVQNTSATVSGTAMLIYQQRSPAIGPLSQDGFADRVPESLPLGTYSSHLDYRRNCDLLLKILKFRQIRVPIPLAGHMESHRPIF